MLSNDQTFPVTSYVIEYRSIHEVGNAFTETVEGTETMAIIENLTDARSYEVSKNSIANTPSYANVTEPSDRGPLVC